MISVSSTFSWLGNQFSDFALGAIDQRLHQGGQAIVAEALALVHVDTGATRASIGYRVEDRTLVIFVGEPSGLFLEFGTRHSRAFPYIRPALAAAGRIFGGSIDMEFNAPAIASPILAHRGGFIVPSSIQPRPLTRAQHEHVRRNLVPVSQSLHRGNVKRARMRIRRFGS